MNGSLSRKRALTILNLEEGFTDEKLRSAYKKAAKLAHPDTGGSHEEFLLVKEAFDQLSKREKIVEEVRDEVRNDKSRKTQKADYRFRVKNYILLIILELAKARFLLRSILGQVILYLYIYNKSVKNYPLNVNFLLYYFIITLNVLSLIIILALFYDNILNKKILKVNFIKNNLKLIRNTAVLLFTTLSFPGYLTYRTIVIIGKIIKGLMNYILD